jgi:hypothetical protein
MVDFIKSILKNHFDGVDFSEIEKETEDNEFEDVLDLDDLAKKIIAGLEECVLTFRPHPLIEGDSSRGVKLGGAYSCPVCHRPHGVWSNEVSGTAVDPNLFENGRRIILVDKL